MPNVLRINTIEIAVPCRLGERILIREDGKVKWVMKVGVPCFKEPDSRYRYEVFVEAVRP